MFKYKLSIGYDGIPLESYVVEAKNISEARHLAYRWMTPDKGYNYITVKRIPKQA